MSYPRPSGSVGSLEVCGPWNLGVARKKQNPWKVYPRSREITVKLWWWKHKAEDDMMEALGQKSIVILSTNSVLC